MFQEYIYRCTVELRMEQLIGGKQLLNTFRVGKKDKKKKGNPNRASG